MVSVSKLNYRQVWEAHKGEFSRLVQIPSMYDAESAGPETPYGIPVYRALGYMKELCRQEGFQITEYDGAAFAASWGTGERIDIVSHLDVVGVTDDWEEYPFSGSIHDGYVHGRGTQDMKSGAYLTFLALKLIKDSGIVPKKEIRLVYGTDEERTMDDMRLYVTKAGLPAFSFTPDGTFPMVNGEKGALMWIMEGDYTGFVRSLSGGIQPNVIPPEAVAAVDFHDAGLAARTAQSLGIDAAFEVLPEALQIRVKGKAAHASRPESGRNAVTDLFRLLAALSGEEMLCRIASCFGDAHGQGAGMGYDISPMGKLSLSPGIVEITNGRIRFWIDCRYPYGVGSDTLTGILSAHFPEYDVALSYDAPPTFTPEDDPYILALKTAYRAATGRACTASISGGVSYAKVFGHCVTFGALAEGSENLTHQKNEKISESDCIAALEIYHNAIKNLMEVAK